MIRFKDVQCFHLPSALFNIAPTHPADPSQNRNPDPQDTQHTIAIYLGSLTHHWQVEWLFGPHGNNLCACVRVNVPHLLRLSWTCTRTHTQTDVHTRKYTVFLYVNSLFSFKYIFTVALWALPSLMSIYVPVQYVVFSGELQNKNLSRCTLIQF